MYLVVAPPQARGDRTFVWLSSLKVPQHAAAQAALRWSRARQPSEEELRAFLSSVVVSELPAQPFDVDRVAALLRQWQAEDDREEYERLQEKYGWGEEQEGR